MPSSNQNATQRLGSVSASQPVSPTTPVVVHHCPTLFALKRCHSLLAQQLLVTDRDHTAMTGLLSPHSDVRPILLLPSSPKQNVTLPTFFLLKSGGISEHLLINGKEEMNLMTYMWSHSFIPTSMRCSSSDPHIEHAWLVNLSCVIRTSARRATAFRKAYVI